MITERMVSPAMVSAAWTALRIDSSAASISTIDPPRIPREGLCPAPSTRSTPSPSSSATRQQIFAVPTSSAAMRCSPLVVIAVGFLSSTVSCVRTNALRLGVGLLGAIVSIRMEANGGTVGLPQIKRYDVAVEHPFLTLHASQSIQ